MLFQSILTSCSISIFSISKPSCSHRWNFSWSIPTRLAIVCLRIIASFNSRLRSCASANLIAIFLRTCSLRESCSPVISPNILLSISSRSPCDTSPIRVKLKLQRSPHWGYSDVPEIWPLLCVGIMIFGITSSNKRTVSGFRAWLESLP